MPKVTNILGASSVVTALAAVVLALGYLVGVGTQSAGAAGKTLYDVTPLKAGWTNSIARDINEKQQIAGQGTNPAGQARAFLWEGRTVTDLGVPAGDDLSRARGINEDGAVVGEWRVLIDGQQRFKAFVYEGGQMKDLNGLIPADSGWALTGAQAINETGQIVGSGTINGETHAFLYENGVPIDLGAILGDPYSAAWGVNDLGDVVGGTGSAANLSEAFVYRDGAVDTLDNLGGFSASEAVGINNSGQAVGWSFNPGQNPPQGKAFLYDNDADGEAEIVPLEPLSADVYSRARDVD